VGISNFTLPVADEVKLLIALRSARDEGALSPRTFAGHRKRAHPKFHAVEFHLFALPVAEQASWFIAPRSMDDAGVRAKESIGHRKRAHPKFHAVEFHLIQYSKANKCPETLGNKGLSGALCYFFESGDKFALYYSR
jgi:hypothetical protein